MTKHAKNYQIRLSIWCYGFVIFSLIGSRNCLQNEKKDVVKSLTTTKVVVDTTTTRSRSTNLLGMGHFDDSNHRERLQNLS